MLLIHEGRCVPAITDELDSANVGGNLPSTVRDLIMHFPGRTWGYGVELLKVLRSRGVTSSILTLVNDWQYVRHLPNSRLGSLRSHFYTEYCDLFPSYYQIIENAGLTVDCLAKIGNHPVFVSETWLRKRAQRRLRKLPSRADEIGQQISWVSGTTGKADLRFDDLDRACRLLICGHADCAGEMMELVCQLYEHGFRTLVNFVPRECENPVNEGTRRAIALFKYHDFAALNISIPFVRSDMDEAQTDLWRAFSVYGQRQGSGAIETFAVLVT